MLIGSFELEPAAWLQGQDTTLPQGWDTIVQSDTDSEIVENLKSRCRKLLQKFLQNHGQIF